MKRVSYFLLIFLIGIMGCKKETNEAFGLYIDDANAPDKQLFLHDPARLYHVDVYDIRLDANGLGELKNDRLKKGYYLLGDADGALLAFVYTSGKGKTDIRFSENGTPQFEGAWAKENEFINIFRNRLKSLLGEPHNYFDLKEDGFEKRLSSLNVSIEALIKETSQGAKKEVVDHERAYAGYKLDILKLLYISNNYDKFDTAQSMMDRMGIKAEYNEEEFMMNDAYREYLDNYFKLQMLPLMEQAARKGEKTSFFKIFSGLKLDLPPQINDYVLMSLLMNYDSADPQSLQADAETINGAFKSNEGKAEFKDFYASIVGLGSGTMPPEITAETVAGKQFTWADFKGKPVLVDIWASWCKPCIQQIPALKELESKYGDKVHFIGMSVDDDSSKWIQALDKYALHQNQFIVSGDDAQSDFSQSYFVSAIPQYVLIDEAGKIVNGKLGYISDLKGGLNPEITSFLDQYLD